ncbi:hypothetical protein BsWGS_00517 [Bradybaena similaris]
MESSPCLILFVLGYCLAVTEGDLRCYCNESGCVSTGYMCKSSAGQCFTSVEIRGETTHQIHGCLDSLPKEHQSSCKVGVDVISASKASLASGNMPFLLCCTEHMCNYREDIDISIILTPKYNGTFQRGSSTTSDDSAVYSKNHHSSNDDDRELWFKAAVIAVPIAGGFILVLLVLLAVRMLRTDSRHHRRLIHIRREHSLTKAHMYISDHFSNKSNKNQFSLFSGNPGFTAAHTYTGKVTAGGSSGGSYMNNCPCASTCFSDSSSSCCSHSLHNDSINNSDPCSAVHSSSHCRTSLPCSSNCRHTSHMNCSTSSDSHDASSSNCVRPCSFFVDSPTSQTSSVKTDSSCHILPHTAAILDTNRIHCERDSRRAPVIPWDTSNMRGPIADV